MKPSKLTEEEKLKINELREKTGEPRLQCIMALSRCDGDIEKSIRWLNTRTFKSYI
jgi:translation elongation factor EF-Ts